jgi:hypothetical protein
VAKKRPSQKSFAERSDTLFDTAPIGLLDGEEALNDPADIRYRRDKTDKTSVKD